MTPSPAAGPPDPRAAARAERRRRLVPVLVALDAVLVAAVLLVVLVTRPVGSPVGSPGATGTATGSHGTASGTPSAAATPGPPVFQLPSGNIACDIKADAVTCTIASKTFTPPATTCKDDSAGHTVVLDAHGVSTPCATGGMPGVAPAGTPVLFYGSSSTVGRYTCTSATNGVKCTDNHGVGFRLAREALVTLP